MNNQPDHQNPAPLRLAAPHGQALAEAARARDLLARHHAALAVARGNAVPLRTARQPQPAPARSAA
ncbi:hypothetical protein ACIRYZ_43800 [Kitasatospora sp. NPDC101155]|uniref:hypothetical protein n=1 Tax=Kitasatospora sp. NPDC101155 TaxID=3364097 RepID=UPI0037FF9CF2